MIDNFYKQTLSSFLSKFGYELKFKTNNRITNFSVSNDKKKFDLVYGFFDCNTDKAIEEILNENLYSLFSFTEQKTKDIIQYSLPILS